MALGLLAVLAGGAIGSVLGTVTWFRGGWEATAIVGALAGGLSLLLFACQLRSAAVSSAACRDP